MAVQKKEAVTVSFHYLMRSAKDHRGNPVLTPFSLGEFDGLVRALQAKPVLNLRDNKTADRVRLRQEAPLHGLEVVDRRTLFGTFKGSYWGHSYDNTAKGNIPADSINLRPFHFLLYFSTSGRIYIACQYLGTYWGYSAIQRTVCDLLPNSRNIDAFTFRLGAGAYRNAQPKEIRVAFSKQAKSISGRSTIGDKGVLVFKRGRKDDTFAPTVANKLFPAFGKGEAEMRKAVAALANESELIDFNEADIENCTMLADVNGQTQTIHMLEEGNFATRFPINVPLGADGHPLANETKAAILDVLRNDIIARKEIA